MTENELEAEASAAPGAPVSLVRLPLQVEAGLLIILAATVLWATPLAAAWTLAIAGCGLVGTRLAFRGLARRQRWVLWYVAALLLAVTAQGILQSLATPPPTISIPVAAIIAVLLLLRLRGSWDPLLRAFAGGGPSKALVGAALALGIVVPLVTPPNTVGLADPTQATARDLSLALAVSCGPSPTDPGLQQITASVTVSWTRHDLLPAGLAAAFSGPREHDAILVEAVGASAADGQPITWALMAMPESQPWLESGLWIAPPAGSAVTVAGGPAGSGYDQTFADGASPNVVVTVIPDRMAIGQSYTETWQFDQRGPLPWPTIRARYVHEYRFGVEAEAGCGQTTRGITGRE